VTSFRGGEEECEESGEPEQSEDSGVSEESAESEESEKFEILSEESEVVEGSVVTETSVRITGSATAGVISEIRDNIRVCKTDPSSESRDQEDGGCGIHSLWQGPRINPGIPNSWTRALPWQHRAAM
jgi:hypothetical protein